MAIKTFTAGTVLTAADTNTYLANSGLVYVAQTRATSGTAIDVLGCFSATYDTYRVILSDVRVATGAHIATVTMLSGSTPASSSWVYASTRFDYNANGWQFDKASGSAQSTFMVANTTSGHASMDIGQPFLPQYTTVHAQSSDTRGTTGYIPYVTGAQLNTTTSYNGLRISFAGTIANCKVTVYGYRLG